MKPSSSLTISADLEHSLSGNYARGLLRRGSARYAILAVPHGESSDTKDNSLTFALLWLARARQASAGGSVAGIRLILPKNTARTVAHRFGVLDPRLKIELYEHDLLLNAFQKIDPRGAGNVDTWLVPVRESESLLQRANPALASVVSSGPKSISLHPSAQTHEVWLRFRGLPFALWEDGRIYFGISDCCKELRLRVRKHLERGEIAHYGYFPGVELQRVPPLVYLVAPALRFHPSTDELLKYLNRTSKSSAWDSRKAGGVACAWSCGNRRGLFCTQTRCLYRFSSSYFCADRIFCSHSVLCVH